MLFNEPKLLKSLTATPISARISCFSALQRAEIAEIESHRTIRRLLQRFSALQRAEIAEMHVENIEIEGEVVFQCSSTSRNC